LLVAADARANCLNWAVASFAELAPSRGFSIENHARLTAELAVGFGCEAVLGFSFGASVALEMVVSAGADVWRSLC
jgi:hypothetical protein